MATGWPGYFPAGPATVRLLVEACADPNPGTGRGQGETPGYPSAESSSPGLSCGFRCDTYPEESYAWSG